MNNKIIKRLEIINNLNTNNLISPLPLNKLAWIITGLSQSDGSFGISFKKSNSKIGYFPSPFFRIELTKLSYPLLKLIYLYFGCGRIGERTERDMVYFEITDFYSIWHIIVPHFINFPFYGIKQQTFLSFVHSLTLLYPYFNKKKPKLLLGKLIYLASHVKEGSGGSLSKKTEMQTHNLYKKLNITDIDLKEIMTDLQPLSNAFRLSPYFYPLASFNVYFLIGIIEGDGSFYIGLRENRKVRFGFSITTHINEIDLLYKIKWFLNCGIAKIKSSTWCRYEVESTNFLKSILIPLVNTVPLYSSKSVKFKAFKEAMAIYTNKEHLTDDGLIKLVKIAYEAEVNKFNSSTRRKYTLEEYLTKNNLSSGAGDNNINNNPRLKKNRCIIIIIIIIKIFFISLTNEKET